MANLYYSYPTNRRGVLRAVLSSEEALSLLGEHLILYFGTEFPIRPDERADFAVLRIFEGELHEQQRAGFYTFSDDVMKVEESVQLCDSNQSRRSF
jgi:hypothetical protein